MQYYFTVTAGRSGQTSFTDMLNKHVPDVYAAFEEPTPRIYLNKISGYLGSLERKFRRKFIETHELLGRGKVLAAYDQGDISYLKKIAAIRLKKVHNRRISTYIDVSKYYARGLHEGFNRIVQSFGLILLVRDPLLNMRSFLNRDKDFYLDNNPPSYSSNLLIMNENSMEKGELYLWAWSEMYLRYLDIIERFSVEKHTVVRTEDLNDPEKMNEHLDRLGIQHTPCFRANMLNTNKMETQVYPEDVLIFERFLEKMPSVQREKIQYFNSYFPREKYCSAR